MKQGIARYNEGPPRAGQSFLRPEVWGTWGQTLHSARSTR